MLASTVSQLRAAVLADLGWVATVTVSDAASGPDAARWIIARATSGGYVRSDGGDPSALLDAWVYCSTNTNLGQQRKVAHYVPELGALAADEPWISALTTSDVLVVSKPFPSINRSGVPGAFELMRAAMQHLVVEAGMTLLTVAGQESYDLTGYRTMLDRQERVASLRLLQPARVAGAPRLPSRGRFRVDFDNGVPTLHLLDRVFAVSGHTFELRGMVPASSYINGAGSLTGIVSDSNTSTVAEQDLVRAVRPFAHRAIAVGAVPGFTEQQRAEHRGLYTEALADARSMPSWDHLTDRLPARLSDDERRAA